MVCGPGASGEQQISTSRLLTVSPPGGPHSGAEHTAQVFGEWISSSHGTFAKTRTRIRATSPGASTTCAGPSTVATSGTRTSTRTGTWVPAPHRTAEKRIRKTRDTRIMGRSTPLAKFQPSRLFIRKKRLAHLAVYFRGDQLDGGALVAGLDDHLGLQLGRDGGGLGAFEANLERRGREPDLEPTVNDVGFEQSPGDDISHFHRSVRFATFGTGRFAVYEHGTAEHRQGAGIQFNRLLLSGLEFDLVRPVRVFGPSAREVPVHRVAAGRHGWHHEVPVAVREAALAADICEYPRERCATAMDVARQRTL